MSLVKIDVCGTHTRSAFINATCHVFKAHFRDFTVIPEAILQLGNKAVADHIQGIRNPLINHEMPLFLFGWPEGVNLEDITEVRAIILSSDSNLFLLHTRMSLGLPSITLLLLMLL